MEINDIKEVSVHSFKTSCCFTGHPLDESFELKISHLKERLVKKALQQHKKIKPCGTKCFQIKEKELLFWFNTNEFTRLLIEELDELIGA
jgi:hypothetical protein